MLLRDLIFHVCRDHGFKNEGKFYRFTEDERIKGQAVQNLTWQKLVQELPQNQKGPMHGEELQRVIGHRSDMFDKTPLEHLPSMFFDEHNAQLYD